MSQQPARRRPVLAVIFAVTSAAAWGCGPGESRPGTHEHRPRALVDQAGAVCGMLVSEQTAPRAQVVHRDGEHAFLCSLGDLLVHLDAPSPHGAARSVFVEVMRPDQDPQLAHTGEHSWQRAEDAVYVVGVERSGVMGPPVLAYASAEAARAVARRHDGARVVDFTGLATWWRARVGN